MRPGVSQQQAPVARYNRCNPIHLPKGKPGQLAAGKQCPSAAHERDDLVEIVRLHDSKGESARTRMMVSAYAARLRLTLASRAADSGAKLDAALEVLGLLALSCAA